ncbi:MAG: tRNA (5-methylaminomethyl-2-thiouridine)(34)-methyltransferase MnmD [Alphaproteobacteria bacterium]
MDGSSNKGAPRSKEFDDVYFSAQDGLAETRHVFLESNDLPRRWEGREQFVIAETGFGTGLNFLATCALYDQAPASLKKLHFISFEKFPLTARQIADYLEPWRREFPEFLDILLDHYPLRTPGFQRMELCENITLTLIFDDINEAIPQVEANVDCWFLDGFRPATNPDMWSDTLFSNMARLSNKGASFGTFTAAGFVKRGLQEAGFEVQKVKGFGRKREMLTGIYKAGGKP